MEGIVFDIQRFSLFDGNGIRTNVFLKGCNLRCLWCHNPESQLMSPQLLFYESKCTGCGKCRRFCPNAFTEGCTGCGKCVAVCEHGAREITGKRMTADEVVREVIKDKAFYETSGGGVTLSGGEPLLQADFAAEILCKCKQQGIHTAIETAANVPWESFQKVLPYLDLILCDIKCIDEEKHKVLTGVSNRRILQNAERLKESGKELLFRVPVIPTLNDGELQSIRRFAGNTPVELLAYHKTGESKYAALGREYALASIEPPEGERMQALAGSIGAKYETTGI